MQQRDRKHAEPPERRGGPMKCIGVRDRDSRVYDAVATTVDSRINRSSRFDVEYRGKGIGRRDTPVYRITEGVSSNGQRTVSQTRRNRTRRSEVV